MDQDDLGDSMDDMQLEDLEEEVREEEGDEEEETLYSESLDESETEVSDEGDGTDSESYREDHSNDSFHSVASARSATLDDSLDKYEDAPLPSRRSTRERKPAKMFAYDELGVGVFKPRSRVAKPTGKEVKQTVGYDFGKK